MKTFLTLLLCGILVIPLAAAHAQESRIELRSFQSGVLGIQKSYNIYLPKDYDKTTERYPVIYLFRGHEREWANPYEDNSRQGRTVKDDADQVAASGKMGNVILVMPGMSSSDNVVPTCAVNLLAPSLAPSASRDGLGTGKFEDYLTTELIPAIDSTFRTIPSRFYRAVDGFSLGGYTSMMLATKHPELFISAGAFDGTLMWLDFTNPARLGSLNDLWVTNSMFDPMFNKPRDIAYMTQYNEANRIKNASADAVRALRQMQFLLHATPNGNDDRTEHVLALLAEKGIANGFSVVNITPDAQHSWYYADMHAMQTFPKHWAKFQSPPASLSSVLTGPAPKSIVSGIVPLSWQRGTSRASTTLLMASVNGGQSWQTLLVSKSSDSTFQWDTRLSADGTRYVLRLLVIADSSLGLSQSAGAFTVNNPGNGAPDLAVTSPAANDTASNQFAITWSAADAEGDSLKISIDFSVDQGASWKPLASSIPNTGMFVWNTTNEVNSQKCLIRIRCTDGSATTESLSSLFAVKNTRYPLSQFLRHESGAGDGAIRVVRVSASPVAPALYRITFSDSGASGKSYSVENLDLHLRVVTDAKIVNGLEGPLFDGMRLTVSDYAVPQPGADSIRWIKGTSTLEAAVSLPEIVMPGGELLKGVPYPADYVITIADRITDTSGTFLDAAPAPMKFSVWNRTEGRKAEVIYNDNDQDAALSRNDELYVVEKNPAGQKELTWQIVFPASDGYTVPAPGDQFLIKILKPFTSRDVFTFKPVIDEVGDLSRTPAHDYMLEQNYPNPFNPETTFRFSIARAGAVRLRIFDILGREAATLVNRVLQPGTYTIAWNANAMSSGIYFYRIDAGEFSMTKKLVLMR